jgi:hypothetical protein
LCKSAGFFVREELMGSSRQRRAIGFSKYWTHLHKCPTDPRNRFGKKCAKEYLGDEIECALQEGAKTLVTLGNPVKKWVNNTKRKR